EGGGEGAEEALGPAARRGRVAEGPGAGAALEVLAERPRRAPLLHVAVVVVGVEEAGAGAVGARAEVGQGAGAAADEPVAPALARRSGALPHEAVGPALKARTGGPR